jgi:hypothetical protein
MLRKGGLTPSLLGSFLVPLQRKYLHPGLHGSPTTLSGGFCAMMPINVPTEQFVIDTLRRTGPCFMDDLLSALPELSWSEIFLAVNRMSGDGQLRLLQVGSSTYVLVADTQQLETSKFQAHTRVHSTSDQCAGRRGE